VTSTGDTDLNGVVPVSDFSPESLFDVIDRLERSTRFQHYILRADELDAVCRHVDTALRAAVAAPDSAAEVERLERLRSAVIEASEYAASGEPREAAESLRPFAA
jgi:hypothetical protein